MNRIPSLALCITLVWTLSAVVPAQAQPGWVLSHQKISDTQGGFMGDLEDDDLFGFSLASLGAALTLPVVVFLLGQREGATEGTAMIWFAGALSALVVWSHRSNIGRLLKGEEGSFRSASPEGSLGDGPAGTPEGEPEGGRAVGLEHGAEGRPEPGKDPT